MERNSFCLIMTFWFQRLEYDKKYVHKNTQNCNVQNSLLKYLTNIFQKPKTSDRKVKTTLSFTLFDFLDWETFNCAKWMLLLLVLHSTLFCYTDNVLWYLYWLGEKPGLHGKSSKAGTSAKIQKVFINISVFDLIYYLLPYDN